MSKTDELLLINNNLKDKQKTSLSNIKDFIEYPVITSSKKIEILDNININNDIQREVELYNNKHINGHGKYETSTCAIFKK